MEFWEPFKMRLIIFYFDDLSLLFLHQMRQFYNIKYLLGIVPIKIFG